MPSSHRGVLLAWGLAVGLSTTAWAQGEFTLGPPKERPVPVKEQPLAPTPERPPAPAKEDTQAAAKGTSVAPAKEEAPEASAVDRCQALTTDKAGQLAIKGGDALANRRYPPAKKLISDALRMQPDVGALHLGLAAAMARMGEVEGAAREYDSFLEACPKHAKVA